MDFLDRLVDRQRRPLTGVRPELPSRYEPVTDAPREVEEVASAWTEPAVRPLPAPVAHVGRRGEPERPAVTQAATRRDSAPVLVPSEPVPAPPPPLAQPVARTTIAPVVERVVERSEPVLHRHLAAPADQVAKTPPSPARQPIPNGERLPTEAAERRSRALPAPMLPGAADRVDDAEVHNVLDEALTRTTTVSISIGRIEIRPSAPVPVRQTPRVEAPVTAPRPAYRPRLSLEEYLDRPDRGWS
ncbi:hypothetical protein FXF50_04635 [Micromonospora sp. AP08]|uniref:hypothetical protein n=1 Tax=Micromonospora sp. AP08 TaxID=2604467 RepID=UPI0011D5ED55|nr:hypothetical protein [Micromonospora sp. AP08]TYB39670.1 hypothetical protein FXF50_04635 [Micromonospora sp. AP08]